MNDASNVLEAPTLSAEQVADYLASHPDFFTEHTWLLEKLYVPHQRGTTVSLVERQTSLLRERNQLLHGHLADMIDAARHNDVQFEKTKRMVLALLEAWTLDDVAVAVEESLCHDFYGDETALLLFSERSLESNSIRTLARAEDSLVQPLIETNLPSCGQLSEAMNRFLFQDRAVKVQSAAVVPLVKGDTLGLLAIGSYDPNYFQSSQGTLFLSYVGEVLSRIIFRILQEQRG
ncbi:MULTISPECIES: DUF484 family protein [Marinobacterium]|jgi:uncharacterized protein YigA (DUF484 family)|uniref:DUF484 domain-containing protein n=1 Tax=Marinobacterium iners DSM 11526 TaxID=1122198 RepID=A0A1H4DD17_9GAMM|nr:DUF484 family protein [Marinobacterium iners]QSR36847.1 hypothetical protein CFI10_18070 [Marinobacterium iners]SEA70655.1 hypothetical protein SAMN02745729_10654 [Marinobacterium iners DSM 11526]